ncbi:unnamed protein product [Paramecium pentaurelia]|uniref:Rab-GAP TBC domain-containing protein n=1 Tax=Paramecium pentaurelia TaxID=43138 RepID=A0A8S1SYY3_9CILI|nr:unnamed protein product [Paramecium pentaurelia]
MGNQALCQHDRTESMLKAEYQIRQRKVTQVNEAVKLDLEQEHKQSLIPTIYQNEQQQTSCLHDWLESLHESVLITQINLNCDASTKFLSEIDEEEEIDQTKQSLIDTQEIFEYKKSYPYCNSNLDMVIINFYILKKNEFKIKLIMGPPKQRIRWSCWQLMAYTPKFHIQSDGLSFVEQDQKYAKAIRKDIHRTVTSNEIKYFETGEGQKDLEWVLLKLSKLFPKLGYCQGMNFLVGFTLIINNKQTDQSLQLLAQMMVNPKYLLYYIYSDEMPLVKLLEFICINEIKMKIPDLFNHIYLKLEVQNEIWITKLIMTLFLYNFHINNVCRFWDYLLATSIFDISDIICSLIDLNRYEILNMEDLHQFIQWFDSYQKKELDNLQIDKLIQNCNQFKQKKNKINQYALHFCILHPMRHPLIQQIAENYENLTKMKEFIKKDIFSC